MTVKCYIPASLRPLRVGHHVMVSLWTGEHTAVLNLPGEWCMPSYGGYVAFVPARHTVVLTTGTTKRLLGGAQLASLLSKASAAIAPSRPRWKPAPPHPAAPKSAPVKHHYRTKADALAAWKAKKVAEPAAGKDTGRAAYCMDRAALDHLKSI